MINRFFYTLSLLFVVGLICQSVKAQPLPSREDSVASSQMYYEVAQEILQSTVVLTQAREMFELAANYDPTNLDANYMAGQTYLETINKERAVKFFNRVYEQNPNYRYDLLYSIGRAHQFGLQFDDALEYFQRYKEKSLADPNYRGKDKIQLSDVNRRIQECENGLKYVKNPKHYSIVNVSARVNSIWPDYAPVVNADETILIFTSRRQEDNLNENVDRDNFYFEDVFISEKNAQGEWSSPRNIGEPINDSFHNSNLSLSPDGNTLYLYRDDNGGDIFFSTREGNDSWSVPQPLSQYINSSFAEKSVSTSPDNELLFFSSNRPGGKGGLDIYMSRKDENGKWGRSKNLGPIINTEFDEESPYIHYDGKTLYFSSRGRDGMGGFDIFKSVYDSTANDWTEPENIGYPINTPDNDVFFVPTKDGKRGYYASVRDDGQGYTDVYMVHFLPDEKDAAPVAVAKREEPKKEEPKAEEPKEEQENALPKPAAKELQPVVLTVTVRDNESGQLLNANVKLRRLSDNQVAGMENPQTGTYRFSVKPKEATEMMLSIEHDGYMFKNFRLKVPAAGEQVQQINRSVELDPLREGLVSVLRNIYFDFDKASFRRESFDELNKLERLLSENADMVVEISGHTDNIGDAAYNKRLSSRRAQAVVHYLTQKGISKARVRAKGYGEERPLASNDDESEGRSLNRRVEFKVLQKGNSAKP